ncbi:MAG: fumarate hydratase [Methanocella sp. PtaU1.Bin125]|nr:MAG: fumarate hydratase [Methanocella sp. PtaU1.Bin125]
MEAMEKIIEDATVELIRRAVTTLPQDVVAALETARAAETEATARRELGIMIENVREAGRCALPMCQDTGIPVFFVKMGHRHVAGLEDALARAVRRATELVPLRRNVVDPLTRANTGDNTGVRMPYVTYSFTDADYLEIAYMPKGAGSENMSALAMLCPPVVVGVGIGGSADACMGLAKKALMRPAGSKNPAPAYARLEEELLEQINATGIGPMGLGGRTTALAVHVERADCHTASLPVGINLQCYAARRASVRVYEDGRVEYGGE